jgi:hypothetical protein
MTTDTTWKRCAVGHKFFLSTWSVVCGPDIHESSDSIDELCKLIQQTLADNEGEDVFVCSVDHWTAHNGEWWGPLDAEPQGIKTLFVVSPTENFIEHLEEEED